MLKWFRQAFEGNDGKASHQKILVMYFTLLFTFMVLSVGVLKYEYPESIYHIVGGVIVGQSAIRAWQSVSDHKIEKNSNDGNGRHT